MQNNKAVMALVASLVVVLLSVPVFAASKVKVLHRFTGRDGSNPVAGVTFDAAGNLYGTTQGGGAHNCGTVFELTLGPNGTWARTVLHSFSGVDGCHPGAGVIFDTSGNLYGTTVQGGTNGVGAIFRLALTGNKPWTTVLHSFNGTDGANPAASVVLDASGNLYGTTSIGGNNGGRGTVFQLKPEANGKWTETVLHSFHGVDGDVPEAALIFDSSGNLYGTTNQGGHQSCGCGVVFKLTAASNGHWTESVLHAFGKKDGAYPAAALVFDSVGNLYSTTARGGTGGGGTVFELSPGTNGEWTETVLQSFSKKDGGPSGVIFDELGSLYGETLYGGKHGYGTTFRLTQANGQWIETILLSFNGADGIEPTGGVILDTPGNIYGTAGAGGLGCAPSGCGVVFEITP